MLAGMSSGICGAVQGVLKAYASVNEILSTIMLNVVAVQFMNFLLRGPLIDPTGVEAGGRRIPQTARLTDSADLPRYSVPVASTSARRSPSLPPWSPTYSVADAAGIPPVRAVGHSTDSGSGTPGIPVKRTIVWL